ncbi:hypothetical protein K440DRAFT_400276 [Wilcoxina mikolae CBS 423.85]|nr:hypothetical protein K440DRAFT_400276 [Wilcoxina mikolae CBS 423.85]
MGELVLIANLTLEFMAYVLSQTTVCLRRSKSQFLAADEKAVGTKTRHMYIYSPILKTLLSPRKKEDSKIPKV